MGTPDGTTSRVLPDGTRLFEGFQDINPVLFNRLFGDDSQSSSLGPASRRGPDSSSDSDSAYVRGPHDIARHGTINWPGVLASLDLMRREVPPVLGSHHDHYQQWQSIGSKR